MDTCLESLWELLRNFMIDLTSICTDLDEDVRKKDLEYKSEIALKCKNIIDVFFISFQQNEDRLFCNLEMPEHVKIFRKALDEFYQKSVVGVRDGAKQASEKVKSCNKCAICKGCAEKFYEYIYTNKFCEKSLPLDLTSYFSHPSQLYYYRERMKATQYDKQLYNQLICLKGFASTTPTIHSAMYGAECLGGGLYLNYEGIGIVIDPGIGFVNSMHKCGIYINNINVVIITHDHLDHNADAEVITSLLHDLRKYNANRGKIVKEVFGLDEVKPHTIKWIVDEKTKKKLTGKASCLNGLKTYIGKKRQLIEKENRIKLSAIKTVHTTGDEDTYGIKLEMKYDKQLVIGYTSDTSYFEELGNFYNCSDILIFNVSDIYKKDIKGIKSKHTHLGYNGSVQLLQNAIPKLAVASEFCCTKGDFRIDLVHALSKEINNRKHLISVIPGEIGLKISFPDIAIQCSICGEWIKHEEMKVITPGIEYGKIQYACGNCVKNAI